MTKKALEKQPKQAYQYVTRYEQNKKKKLERLIKLQPNNKQLESALKNIRYKRKATKVPFWSSSRKRMAYLYMAFAGKVNLDIFNNNDKISGPALFTKGPHSEYKQKDDTSEFKMFRLSERARDKYGNLVWKS